MVKIKHLDVYFPFDVTDGPLERNNNRKVVSFIKSSEHCWVDVPEEIT